LRNYHFANGIGSGISSTKIINKHYKHNYLATN